ncbi:MAG: hypothetical protein DME26_10620 [Verrucomicrobia bacterium]|nr:MAG: hypothetical protein DME26_10620 [Verrucomicrobiota bacterium]
MKVLLDVCTPVQVRNALPAHEVHTAARMGWGELGNGELLRVAEDAGFYLLIICDRTCVISRISPAGNSPSSNSGQTTVPRWKSIGRTSGRMPKRCGPMSTAHFKRHERCGSRRDEAHSFPKKEVRAFLAALCHVSAPKSYTNPASVVSNGVEAQ